MPIYGQVVADNALSFRNRIINGAMEIDQRNSGSSVGTGSGSLVYIVDRWNAYYNQTNKFTVQQNAGSVTPPAGFKNYLGVTSSSAYSVGSEEFSINQMVEGFNWCDLNFGTANARTITLSFWVRSSLTGTFGGAIRNYSGNRSYPYSYTISSANTWEYKTVTISGDTGGTWVGASNAGAAIIGFGLGVGSSNSGTAGSWVGSNLQSVTGAVSVVGTNAATWYITGVQLEVGSVATPFERRPYGTELALCQRYYYKVFPGASSRTYGNGTSVDTTTMYNMIPSPVTMRVSPTLQTTGTASDYAIVRGGGTNTACNSVPTISDQSNEFVLQVIAGIASGLTSGGSGWLRTASTSSYLGFNAEL